MDADLSLNHKGYLQAIQRNTVKEMLKMNRQKWNHSQDDDNVVHKFKSAKFKTFQSEWSPHIVAPQVAVNQNIPTHLPAAFPESVCIQPHQMQRQPATAEVRMSLFQWQIQTEAQRIGEASSEMLNMQDADGDTILHIAVAQGRRALAYVLAAKMATCGSLDRKEHNGQTALQIATVTNQHLIVQDLLTHGAQVNTCDSWGRSPLYVSAEKGHFLSLKTIWRTLCKTGQPVDVEMCNYDGLTPLHAAVLSHNRVNKELRCLENPCSYIVQELVKKKHMFVECIKILLIMGASVTTKDLKSGRTWLHMASEEANVELLQFILDQTMSMPIVNAKTFSGNTALHIVSSLQNHKGQVEAVKLLMRKGADPGIRNSENELPSQLVPEGPIGEKVRQILKGNMLMHK